MDELTPFSHDFWSGPSDIPALYAHVSNRSPPPPQSANAATNAREPPPRPQVGRVCSYVAAHFVHLVEVAREHGCPWDTQAYTRRILLPDLETTNAHRRGLGSGEARRGGSARRARPRAGVNHARGPGSRWLRGQPAAGGHRHVSDLIKAPTHNKRSGVWVWAFRKNGPWPGRAKPISCCVCIDNSSSTSSGGMQVA